MNQSQIKYARERAAALKTKREAALREKHTTPAVILSCEDKLKALKDGKFKTSAPGHGWWHSVVTFNAERKSRFDQKAFDAEMGELTDSYTKLIDELVLGDNEEALRLLKAFEAA